MYNELQKNDIIPEDFEQWVYKHLGPTIRDVFFKPYSRKVILFNITL